MLSLSSSPATTTTTDGLDPVVSIAQAVLLNRTDVINSLLRKHGSSLGGEVLDSTLPMLMHIHEEIAEESPQKNHATQTLLDVIPGDTVLHLACRLGHVDALRALLRAGVPVGVRNSRGELAYDTRLESNERIKIEQAFAAEMIQNVCSGLTSRVEKLLEGGVPPTITDGSPEDGSLLHWAVAFGHGKPMISVLCDSGADPNVKNRIGNTPAHEACLANRIETLEALYECGADLDIRNSQGQTPRDLAKDPEIVKFFADHKSITIMPRTPIKTLQHPSSHTSSNNNGGDLKKNNMMNSPNISSATTTTNNNTKETALKIKIEEQEALISSLRNTIEVLLNEKTGSDDILRLKEHCGALTRQLASTAEQRDKLQTLYMTSDREVERLARELAALKVGGEMTGNNNNNSGHRHHHNNSSMLLNGPDMDRIIDGNIHLNDNDDDDEPETIESLRTRCHSLAEALERERKEAYAAARLHLTYEADLRSEIKALHEQLLKNSLNEAQHGQGGDGSTKKQGIFASLIPW
jgi:hypothetical protein